jgi:3-oxoacyl-[acyl-carrier protein] reductase
MNLELKGKNVIVLGGTRGIGLTIANKFVNEGARVFVLARNIEEIQNSEMINYFCCDVTFEDDLRTIAKKIFKKTNKIDIVISNVGDGSRINPNDSEMSEWYSSWNTNFISAFNAALIFEEYLRESNGTLIFISSIAGVQYINAPIAYSVAKNAIISLAKTLSFKLAPHVRVNVISPGNIFIENGSWHKKIIANKVEIERLIESIVPLKRFGTPEEIADLVLFISSSKASFITGSNIIIDGGQTTNF